jgi:hypothetical protein
MARPARKAVWKSRVHTPAPRPYSVSLAWAMASSKPSNEATETTGPKISSWNTRILLWPSKTVGAT